MKFKKLLSFALAITMAFTSTLSSSVYGIADDTQETEESQSFGSIILEKMKNNYEDSDSNDIYIEGSNNNDSGIVPLWKLGTHDEIINNNYSGYIPEKYIDLVIKICRWCDDPTKIWETQCMHGFYNYAASLKLLWKYAQVIGDKNISGTYSQLSANAKKVSLALFDNKLIKKNDTAADDDDYSELVKLAIRAEAVINTYGKSKTPEERKYLIYGMILHLLGDITAHRTIIPQYMVDRATDPKYANSDDRFNKNDFDDDDWKVIKNKIKEEPSFSGLKKHLSISESDYSNFYIDNPKVVPNRVLASETMADYFLHYFNKGFDISILDNIPYSYVKLKDYSTYRNEG